jgi:hypothetical protein
MDKLLWIFALIAFIIAAAGVFARPARTEWAGIAYIGLALAALTFIL